MSEPRVVHVVDDDDAVRESAEILLDSAGYEVVPHESGNAFLEVVADARGGCILLDIHMPGLTGLEVQAELKSRNLDWPVIVLTGQGDVGIAVQAMKNGAFEFLEKPYKNEALLETLEDAFEALIGALYLDTDLATTRKLVLKWYGPLGDRLVLNEEAENPKGRLQEMVQPAHGNTALRYEVTATTGPRHARAYEVAVFLHDEKLGTGQGSSKKHAEEQAARTGLAYLQAKHPPAGG